MIIKQAITLLNKLGVSVYVDWLDSGMPKYTDGSTAKRIKDKIRQNDKFILLATESAINSKWCNWELGLGDAAKYINNIALFPINKSSQSFYGSEYLRIYPRIEYQDGTTKYTSGFYIPSGYYVIYPVDESGNSIIYSLKDWLKRK